LAPAIARAQSIVPATPEAEKIAAATDAANHLTIEVMINGKGPFRFVVDTGADRSVIADDVAASLGLLRGPLVNVEGVVRTLPAQTVALSEISFGSVRQENIVVPALPRAFLDADGYLGLDVVDGYRVTLDFRNRALLVEPPRHMQLLEYSRPNEAVVPVFGKMGHLRAVNSTIDNVMATTFIDTGAEVSVGNSKLFEALSERDPSYSKQESVLLSGITGGTIAGRVIDINRIKINSLMIFGSKIVIADLQIFDLWGLGEKPALLIGMNFLRGFNEVAIDYGRKQLRFDLASLIVAQQT
jgi:predicted aspartyl protease